MSKKLRLFGVADESVVDGTGIRMTIFAQGCSHHCEGCHNEQSWSYDGGYDMDIDELARAAKKNPLLDGFTFSGGEPFEQAEAFAELAQWAHDNGLNIWCYSGYTLEQLLDKAKQQSSIEQLLQQIDVLVDGRFILKEKDLMLKFKGSKNQRIIDLVATRKSGYNQVILKF